MFPAFQAACVADPTLDSVAIDDLVFMDSIGSKRIPDPPEAAVAEVLFVDGGEVGDALLDEEGRGPPIVGAAEGEIGFAEFRPEGFMKAPAARRESDDLPTGGLAAAGFFHGGGSVRS